MTPSPDHRTLADLAADGPVAYERFLDIASEIALHLLSAHESGRVFGNLTINTIAVEPGDRLQLPATTDPGDDSASAVLRDLQQVGRIYLYLLTGARAEGGELANMPLHPVLSETQPLDDWSLLLPPEAKLLIEQLLSNDPADRISSAKELMITLDEMKKLHKLPVELAADMKASSAKLYFIIAMTVLALIIIVILLAIFLR